MKVDAMDDFSDKFKSMTQWQEQIFNLTKGLNISISKSLAAMTANYMHSYSFPFEQINNQLKILSKVIYPEIYNSITSNMIQEVSTALRKFAESYSISMRESIQSFYSSYSTSILQQFRDSQLSFSDITNFYTGLENQSKIQNSFDEEEIDNLTDDDKKQIVSAIEDVINSDPQTWNQNAKKKIDSLSTSHPKIAKAIIWFLLFILQYFLQKSFDLIGETISKANVRENPVASSQVLTVVDNRQQVFILDDQPYYYEIKFTDDTTGDTYKGWISKRSVKKFTDSNDDSN